MKHHLYYYRNSSLKSKSTFVQVKNKKFSAYLKYYSLHHSLRPNEDCSLMVFEEFLSTLKSKIKEACASEARLIEQMVKPSLDMSVYETKLAERHANK